MCSGDECDRRDNANMPPFADLQRQMADEERAHNRWLHTEHMTLANIPEIVYVGLLVSSLKCWQRILFNVCTGCLQRAGPINLILAPINTLLKNVQNSLYQNNIAHDTIN